jgi:hypothetical protein
MSKLFMNKNNSNSPKTPPPNSIGATRPILKNQIGTLKGMLGTIGGEKQSKPKGGASPKSG